MKEWLTPWHRAWACVHAWDEKGSFLADGASDWTLHFGSGGVRAQGAAGKNESTTLNKYEKEKGGGGGERERGHGCGMNWRRAGAGGNQSAQLCFAPCRGCCYLSGSGGFCWLTQEWRQSGFAGIQIWIWDFWKRKTATRSIFTFHSGCWDKKKSLESLSGVRKIHLKTLQD